MTAVAWFCPACAHRLAPFRGVVVGPTGSRDDVRFMWCVGCALVTEVSDAAQLVDLGHLDLNDVLEPIRPDDEHHVPILALDAGRPLEGRRDS